MTGIYAITPAFSGISTDFRKLTAYSISSFVLYLLKEKRTVVQSSRLASAFITCDPPASPLVQALPPETQMPAWSSSINNDSVRELLGKQTLSTVYSPCSGPLKRTFGRFFCSRLRI